MPGTITLGHVLMALAALAAVAAAASARTWSRHRGHGRGTPQYARYRTARRHAAYAAILAVLLLAAGCLTPLRDIALVGGGA